MKSGYMLEQLANPALLPEVIGSVPMNWGVTMRWVEQTSRKDSQAAVRERILRGHTPDSQALLGLG